MTYREIKVASGQWKPRRTLGIDRAVSLLIDGHPVALSNRVGQATIRYCGPRTSPSDPTLAPPAGGQAGLYITMRGGWGTETYRVADLQDARTWILESGYTRMLELREVWK